MKCECGVRFWSFTIAGVGAFLIVAALVMAMVDYTKTPSPAEDRAKLRHDNLSQVRAANAEIMDNANYAWQDQSRGVVRMPMPVATEMFLRLWRDKAAARSNLIARVEKATAPLPKAPEKPSPFE